MPETFDAGSVVAQARLDREQLRTDINQVRDDLRKLAAENVRIDVGINDEAARSAVRVLKREIEGTSATIQLDADTTVFREKMQQALRLYSPNVEVTLSLNEGDFRQKVKDAVQGASADTAVKVRLGIDENDFRARLDAIVNTASQGVAAKVKVDVDDATLKARMKGAVDTAAVGLGTKAKVDVNADTSSAHASLAGLVPVITGIGYAFAAAFASTAATGLLGSVIAIVGALEQAAGAALLMPAGLVAAGAAAAALKIGMQGVSAVFQAFTAQSAAAGTEATALAAAVQSAQNGIISSSQGVASANQNLEASQDRLRTANQALTDSYQQATDALDNMNDALAGQKLSEEGAGIAVEKAKLNLDKVNASTSSTALQRHEADLQYRQSLLTLDVAGDKTEQLQRTTDVANKAGVNGSAQVTAAKDQVEKAAQREQQAQQGVENAMRAQTQAVEALALAYKNASPTTDALNKAMEKLAPTAQDFVTQIHALAGAWSSLQLDVQSALFAGLGDRVTTFANAQLPVLHSGLTNMAGVLNNVGKSIMDVFSTPKAAADFQTTLTNSATLVDNIGKAFAPLARVFMDLATVGSGVLASLTGGAGALADRFAAFMDRVRESGVLEAVMRQGLTVLKEFGELLHNVGSIFQSVFSGGAALGNVLLNTIVTVTGEFASFLKSADGKDQIAQFFKNTTDALKVMDPIIKVLVPAIMGLLTAFSGFAQVVTPSLLGIVKGLAAGLDSLYPALQALAGPIATLGTAIGPLFAALAGALGPAIVALAPVLTMFINLVSGPLTAAVQAVTPLFVAIADTVAHVLMTAMQAIAPIIPIFSAALAGIAIALTPLLPVISKVADQIINALAPALPIVAGYFTTWSSGMPGIVSGLKPILESIGNLVQVLAQDLMPVLPVLVSGFSNILPGLLPIIEGPIPRLIDLLGKLANVILPPLVNLIVRFGDVLAPMLTAWLLWHETGGKVISTMKDLKSGFDAVMVGINALRGGWIRQQAAMVASTAKMVLHSVASAAHAVAAGIASTASGVWTAAQWLFNAALDANPIGIVIVVIAALVAGIIYAYTHSETFRKIIDGLWQAIQIAFEKIKEFLGYLVGQWIEGWNQIKDGTVAAWNAVYSFVMAGVAMFRDGWNQIWDGIVSAYRAVWGFLSNAATSAWDGIKSFFDTALSVFSKFFSDTWTGIVKTFSDIWGGLTGIAKGVWDQVKGFFIDGVNSVIAVIDLFADAINKIGGLLGLSLNLHIDPIPKSEGGAVVASRNIPLANGGPVFGLAAGGPTFTGMLPGYSPGVDTLPAFAGKQPYILAGGEYVVRPEATRALGPKTMEAINNAHNEPVGISRARAFGGMIGLADGGQTYQALDAIRANMFPGSIDTSDFRAGDPGYHGLGMALDIGVPGNGQDGLMPIADELMRRFGNATEIIHNPNGSRKDGRNVSPDFWGAETWASHQNHVHWAMTPEALAQAGANGDGSGGLLGGVESFLGWIGGGISAGLRTAVDTLVNPIKSAVTTAGNTFGMPGQFTAGGVNKVLDAVIGMAGSSASGGNIAYDSSGGAEQWRSAVIKMMNIEGFNGSDVKQVNAVLSQINTESSGNPNAVQGNIGDVNNASGDLAKGLLQVIGATFATNRDPAYPNNVFDPEANIAASLRYYRNRYGNDLTSVMGQGHGYDEGGIASGIGYMAKRTIEPERVLSPAQTMAFESMLPIFTQINTMWKNNASAVSMDARAMGTTVDPSVSHGAAMIGLAQQAMVNINRTTSGNSEDSKPSIHITVLSQPGQSTTEIATEVKRQLLFEMR